MAPRLDLRQAQTLVMTPQLQQAIRLLALSNVEIEAFLAEAVDRNPLLERDEAPDGGAESGAGRAGDDAGGPADLPADLPASAAEQRSDEWMTADGGNGAEALDMDLRENLFPDDMPPVSAPEARAAMDIGAASAMGADAGFAGDSGGGALSGDAPDLDQLAAGGLGLGDYLEGQARASFPAGRLQLVLALIEQLDESGWLTADLDALAVRLGVTAADMAAALADLQSLDPAGVGARTLSECLALQAREADRYDPAMAALIDNLDLLAKGQWARLMKICGVDEEDLRDMVAELRGYDPKPGARFSADPAPAIAPDIFVRETADGGWSVEMNSATLPRLLVNRVYHAELAAHGGDRAAKSWLSECLADANWLVKAMDQRQRTIIRVASEIVRQQAGFFRHGVAHLRPMTLKQVAEAVEMHESTVSRVTSHKYLSCARGTFELKYFFTSAIQGAEGGEAASAAAVKAAIRALIDAEPPRKILSDDQLVLMLKDKGFDIARRTVAKYREAMGIGSSVQRRRQKALAG